MKQYFLFCLGFLLCLISSGQKVEIISNTVKDNAIEIIIQNKTKYGQSVELNCELKGMIASEALPKIAFLKPNEELVFVTLKPKDIYKAYSYGTSIKYVEGDVTAIHDDDYIYHLPYPNGVSYKVDQGYNGNKTHQGQFAIDFNMDQGSEIAAIRGGIVSKVVDNNEKGCPSEQCNQYNNYILITHDDGSIADYSHLKKRGAKVKVGDKVKSGEVIALSGSTGWASGPHLHLEVYIITWNGQNTIEAKYYINNDEVGIPVERKYYKSSN